MHDNEETLKNEADFIIRSYQKGDETRIVDMFNEVFSQNRELTHWRWKHETNPGGPAVISLAESPDGIIAAHFGSYPLKLCYFPSEGKKHIESTAYHAGDKMTRRQFRSTGFGKSSLLARTFKHLTDSPKQPDTSYTFGFMTHHSLRFGLLLLNYSLIEPVPYRRLSWSALSDIRLSLSAMVLMGIRAEDVSVVDDSWTDFFWRAAPHYRYLVRRDAAYVKWRYLERPDRKYLLIGTKQRSNLTGWSVFWREGTKIIWGDALYEKGNLDSLKAALIFLRSHPIAEGAENIECWFPSRPDWWDSILYSVGFRAETEPNNLCFCIGILEDREAPERVKNMLYYSMGDSDLF